MVTWVSHGTDMTRKACRFGAQFLLVPDEHGMHGVKLGAEFVLHVYRKGRVC